VKGHPEHYLAKALLGVAYLLTPDKREEGKRLIAEAGEKSDDPTIKNLSSVCLEWLSKDLQNKPLPMAKMGF
jgi:hypothetical protein